MNLNLHRDERFMRAALNLGQREMGQAWPNPAVGALVVDAQGMIIGRGWTQAGGRPHAEPVALAEAGERARGATLYVTLEPCSHYGKTPPCAEAIIKAGIKRVVCAIGDPDTRVAGRGFVMLRDAGIEVTEHVLEAEACRDHAGHRMRVMEGRPLVHVKMALSADEKIAAKGNVPVQITGITASAQVQRMRAEYDAIAIGIGTVLSDDPQLTCRLAGMENRSPVRVVFDRDARLPLHSRLVQTARTVPVWVICKADADHGRQAALQEHGVEIITETALFPALHALSRKGITRLMVEGGATLVQSLATARLMDRLTIFQAPLVLGGDAVAAFPTGFEDFAAQNNMQKILDENYGTDRAMVFERQGLCLPV